MNQPRTQIYDVNTGGYAPDWTSAAGKLIITPVVYANQTAIALTDNAITITWKRREGSSAETALTAGETVSGNVLTISANKLAGVSSGLLTYIAYISYLDPDNGLTTNATADISFALVKTGENAKSAWISGAQVFKYDADGAVSPAQITLTANVQNVVLSKWQYRNASDVWQDYPTTGDNATITGTSLIVKPTHGIWVGDCATLRIVTNDANISDIISIYKVSDGAAGGAGADGQPASIAFLSNENITFTANASGQANASTVICNVQRYEEGYALRGRDQRYAHRHDSNQGQRLRKRNPADHCSRGECHAGRHGAANGSFGNPNHIARFYNALHQLVKGQFWRGRRSGCECHCLLSVRASGYGVHERQRHAAFASLRL